MLRPATPLTILLFFAFVILLLATLSAPLIKGIPLASVNGVNLGVFGFCTATQCSKIQIGYTVDQKLLFGSGNPDFIMPASTRKSLSSILIVHPVAALLTLICLILAATSHLHGPARSPKYLIGLVVLSVFTFLITLLAFLIDILLFYPHLAWGGWILIGAILLILAGGILTCAMRRTLVNRKESQRRVAENDDMNGNNFYASQNPVPQGVRADSPPPLLSGALDASEKPSNFATFEKTTSREEDRVPLNSRMPSDKTLPSMSGNSQYNIGGPTRYEQGGRGGPMGARGPRGGMGGGMRGARGGYGVSRDQYGNPMPPSNAFGQGPGPGYRRDRSEPPMRRQYSDEALNQYGGRGRGRGGYPPRGYGRGAYGPERGGYGGRGGPNGQSPSRGMPPPGYGNEYSQYDRPGQYDGSGPGPAGYGRSPSAPGGYRRRSPGPPSAPGGYGRNSPGFPAGPGGYAQQSVPLRRGPPSDPGGRGYEDSRRIQQHGQPSPPLVSPSNETQDMRAIGQAVEMDARHGSPSPSPGMGQMRPGEAEPHGPLGYQRPQQPLNHRDSPQSLTSMYSTNDAYVPPRAAWKEGSRAGPSALSNPPTIPINDAIELPVQTSSGHSHGGRGAIQNHNSNNRRSEDYYEDVDPRFVSQPPLNEAPVSLPPNPSLAHRSRSSGTVPSALMPGSMVHRQPISGDYDDMGDGQRSPASDHSNMTSISQRGVNPNWRPPPSSNIPAPQPHHHLQQQQRNMVLDNNPDFGLPARGGMGGPAPPQQLSGRALHHAPPHGQAF